MVVTVTDSLVVADLDTTLETIQAGPPGFVLLEVDEGHERRVAVSILRRLTPDRLIQEFTFRPEALDFRAFLAASPEKEGGVVFLFGLAGLRSEDRERAWRSLNMARETIRASRRSFVFFVAPPYTDEFSEYAPDLRACVTAHFKPRVPASAHMVKHPLVEKTLPEVQRLLRQAAYYESRIAEPARDPYSRSALLRDYADLLEGIGEPAKAGDLRAQADRLAAAPAEESPWVLQDYLEGILKETSVIRLSDLAVQVGQQILEIALDDIYVPLRLLHLPMRPPRPRVEPRFRDISGDVSGLPFPFQPSLEREERSPEPISVEDALSLGSLVILGDPGTGKSTFLRWMARVAVKALLGQPEAGVPQGVLGSLRDRVPILIQARLMADRLAAAEEDPVAALAASSDRTRAATRVLEGRLRAGRCLVLVDGVDEIPSAEGRDRTRSAIETLARQHPGNRILVTSRIVGYDPVRLGSPFEHVTLTELDEGGIRGFTRQWYRTISRVSPAVAEESPERRAEILFDAIAKSPGIRRIAGNPLLLTIIALVHWRGGRLPEKRAAVYEAAINTLLDNWLARRPWVKLNVDEMISVLSQVAFDMHEAGETGLIPESRLHQLFCDKLAEVRLASVGAVRGDVQNILATLSQHSGLFLERGLGEDREALYGFLHLTFQEYLAALQLFRRWAQWVAPPDGRRRPSAKRRGNPVHPLLFHPRWHEVVLLAAGRASDSSDSLSTAYVRRILSYSDKYESILRRALLLAARILADGVRVDRITAKEICRELVELLTATDLPSQLEACTEIISRFRGTNYASLVGDELLSRLRNLESNIRRKAAWALGALKDPRALEPLLQTLDDADWSVQQTAAWALGALKDPRALEPLRKRLDDSDWNVRESAAWGLRHLSDAQTMDLLLRWADDPDRRARWVAVRSIAVFKDPRAMQSLLNRLDDTDWNVRDAAFQALGMLRDPRAIDPLLKRLGDSDPQVRQLAAWALGSLGDRGALDPLLQRLEDPDRSVRAIAAWALGGLRDIRALEPLLTQLKDPDWNVRQASARALGAFKHRQALESILKALKDPDWNVREAAIWALGEFNDPSAIKAVSRIALKGRPTIVPLGMRGDIVAKAWDALFRLLYSRAT